MARKRITFYRRDGFSVSSLFKLDGQLYQSKRPCMCRRCRNRSVLEAIKHGISLRFSKVSPKQEMLYLGRDYDLYV